MGTGTWSHRHSWKAIIREVLTQQPLGEFHRRYTRPMKHQAKLCSLGARKFPCPFCSRPCNEQWVAGVSLFSWVAHNWHNLCLPRLSRSMSTSGFHSSVLKLFTSWVSPPFHVSFFPLPQTPSIIHPFLPNFVFCSAFVVETVAAMCRRACIALMVLQKGLSNKRSTQDP